MSELGVVVLAVATALGAWSARPVPLTAALAVSSAALVLRRVPLLWLAAFVLASSLGARAWDGLRSAPTSGLVVGEATLVTDPVDVPGGVRAELRFRGRRVEAWARGPTAAVVGPRLAGERLHVTGELAPLSGRRRSYLLTRHVGARLQLHRAEHRGPGDVLARLANDARRTLLRGASSLAPEQRALLAGVVLGDDRAQSQETRDAFRAAGLSHLLAVSGQNVAFVLALASSLLGFLGLRARLVASSAVLVAFGVLTRWEPSVVRAEAMAAVTLVAVAAGRPASTVRVWATAVTILLLVDPLLVRSLGFLLSAGACAGIALLAGPLSRRGLPLPLAATLAAQVGVTPVLLPVFGGLPVAAVPANLLAVPAAGPLMIWGMAVGVPAGILGGPVATVLHLPTRALVAWLAGVADLAAGVGLGILQAPHVLLLVGCAALAAACRRLRLVAALGAVAVCLVAAVPTCRFGPCASPSAIAPTTWPPGRSSWASSIAPPTPSTTRAPTTGWTPFSSVRHSSWPRAPTCSTSVG